MTAEPEARRTPQATAPDVLQRVIGRWRGTDPGPTLICIVGVHGNEPAGVEALQRVFGALATKPPSFRGELLGLAGNLKALARQRRYVSRDLNRLWSEERVAARRSKNRGSLSAEEAEMLELLEQLEAAERRADGPIYVLDLHTTSGGGTPFIVLGDTISNRKFAREFPVPMILGLEEHVDGTLSEFLANRGLISIAFEAGQHESPDTVDRAEAAVWIALRSIGLLGDADPHGLSTRREVLARYAASMPRVFEILYRHSITTGDGFEMEPGFRNLERVSPGRLLARDRHGEIRSRWSGWMVMPLYQRLGSDGFFIARPVLPIWMWLSSALRRLRLHTLVHWLPGVRHHPERPDTLVVDRRVARWLAMDVLHLLGYRKVRALGQLLLVSRRRHDLPSNR